MTSPSDQHRHELKQAIVALEQSLPVRKTIDHHLVRAVLVPLGYLVAAGENMDRELKRIGVVIEARKKSWEQAVVFEMKLAIAEHVLSVDLRFLNRPDYDFDYTVRARERLEARFVAADALGTPVQDQEWKKIEQADAILKPFLEARAGGEPSN